MTVVVLHEGARIAGGVWMLGGLALYVIYRRSQGKPLTKRFTIPEAALKEAQEVEYGSILVPVFGGPLDDDIVGTAGRLATDHADEGEGGAMLEAVYVFEMPMSLPIDARVSPDKVAAGRKALARAKEVGEEYEGVEVATATDPWPLRRLGHRRRGQAARCGGHRAGRRAAQPHAWRRPLRGQGQRRGPVRREHHALRGREGALQGHPDRLARGRSSVEAGAGPDRILTAFPALLWPSCSS